MDIPSFVESGEVRTRLHLGPDFAVSLVVIWKPAKPGLHTHPNSHTDLRSACRHQHGCTVRAPCPVLVKCC